MVSGGRAGEAGTRVNGARGGGGPQGAAGAARGDGCHRGRAL